MAANKSIEEMKEILKDCNHYGCGHIVFADNNIEDDHIQWCLDREHDPTRGEHEVFEDFEREFLIDLLKFSYEDRCKIFDKEQP